MSRKEQVCRYCGAALPEAAERCPICERPVYRPRFPDWVLPVLALGLCVAGLLAALISAGVGLALGVAAVLLAGIGMGFESRLRYPALVIAVIVLIALGIWCGWVWSSPQITG